MRGSETEKATPCWPNKGGDLAPRGQEPQQLPVSDYHKLHEMAYPGLRLHQIGPYIGKLRPDLARKLVLSYSAQGGWVWDPFAGCGTIPLECRLLGRNVLAGDINPYACALTRAKLHAPTFDGRVLQRLSELSIAFLESGKGNRACYPEWVRRFFHPRTLRETSSLMQHLLHQRQYFLAGCLLGILHHQRPGFLSYPASHLVPYLRDKMFPRDRFPQAYEYREPISRLRAKAIRVLRDPPQDTAFRYRVIQKSVFEQYLPPRSVDAIITSPPYMNALDYARDNRLRLWFLGIDDYSTVQQQEMRKIGQFQAELEVLIPILTATLKPGAPCILILGDAARNGKRHDIPGMIKRIVTSKAPSLTLEATWKDGIPAAKRSRRHMKGTKSETVLVYRKRR